LALGGGQHPRGGHRVGDRCRRRLRDPRGGRDTSQRRRFPPLRRCRPARRTWSARYIFVVHAVDVPRLELDETASPAFLGFNLSSHTLGRATIAPVYEQG